MLGFAGMVFSLLAQTRMRRILYAADAFVRLAPLVYLLNGDLTGLRQPQCQFIPVYLQLHGIAHRRQLYHRHFRAGNDAHVQKMLPKCAFAANTPYHCTFSDLQIL